MANERQWPNGVERQSELVQGVFNTCPFVPQLVASNIGEFVQLVNTDPPASRMRTAACFRGSAVVCLGGAPAKDSGKAAERRDNASRSGAIFASGGGLAPVRPRTDSTVGSIRRTAVYL
jgi:hypothetical protein